MNDDRVVAKQLLIFCVLIRIDKKLTVMLKKGGELQLIGGMKRTIVDPGKGAAAAQVKVFAQRYYGTKVEELGVTEAADMFKEQNGLKGVQMQKTCSHKKEMPPGIQAQDVDLQAVLIAGPVINNPIVGKKDPEDSSD